MRGVALTIFGLALAVFAGALQVASAIKGGSSGEGAGAAIIFLIAVVFGIWGTALAHLDHLR